MGGIEQINLPPSRGCSSFPVLEAGISMISYIESLACVTEMLISEPSSVCWGCAVVNLILASPCGTNNYGEVKSGMGQINIQRNNRDLTAL